MKRIISFFSALMIFVSCFAFSVSADDVLMSDTGGHITIALEGFSDLTSTYTHYFILCYRSDDTKHGYSFFGWSDYDSTNIVVNGSVTGRTTMAFKTFYIRDSDGVVLGSGGTGSVVNLQNDFNQVCRNWSSWQYSVAYIHDYSVTVNGDNIVAPTVAPIEVNVEPYLHTNMSGKTISYPSKNGGTVTDTMYNYTVTVSLTNGYRERWASVPSAGYSFVAFIVPSEYSASSDIDVLASHSIYTHSVRGYYYNDEYANLGWLTYFLNDTLLAGFNTSAVDNNYSIADGYTNAMYVNIASPSYSFSIEAEHVPYEANKTYNLVIYACTNCYDLNFGDEAASTYFLKSGYSRSMNYQIEEGDVAGEYVSYTWLSDDYNYNMNSAGYPEYSPVTINGQPVSANPFEYNSTPLEVWDRDMLTNNDNAGTENAGMSIDDFNEYLKQKEWGSNFSTDYDVGDITDMFNGESTFFGFITASISVLPSWFLTILSAFFVTLLTVIIIKFLI